MDRFEELIKQTNSKVVVVAQPASVLTVRYDKTPMLDEHRIIEPRPKGAGRWDIDDLIFEPLDVTRYQTVQDYYDDTIAEAATPHVLADAWVAHALVYDQSAPELPAWLASQRIFFLGTRWQIGENRWCSFVEKNKTLQWVRCPMGETRITRNAWMAHWMQ